MVSPNSLHHTLNREGRRCTLQVDDLARSWLRWMPDEGPYSCGTALDCLPSVPDVQVTSFTVTARAFRGDGHLQRVTLFSCALTIGHSPLVVK